MNPTEYSQKKWRVRVTVTAGKTVHVGFFDTELDAARAYDAFIITSIPGSAAAMKLNFPRVSLAAYNKTVETLLQTEGQAEPGRN